VAIRACEEVAAAPQSGAESQSFDRVSRCPSRLLADRGWGKAPAFAPVEDKDPLGLEKAEQAAERFTAEVLRLVSMDENGSTKPT
jgi:hypothetical protein